MNSDPETTAKDDHSGKILKIRIPESLQQILEDDCYKITVLKQVDRLPYRPNIATLLEDYVVHVVNVQLPFWKSRSLATCVLEQDIPIPPERDANICRQVVEGIRIYFDFMLPLILLYAEEQEAYDKLSTITPSHINDLHLPHFDFDEFKAHASPRRSSRNKTNCDSLHKKARLEEKSQVTKAASEASISSCKPNPELADWSLYPPLGEIQGPTPPCLLYGPVHLLRLFVQLPTLLCKTDISEKKQRLIVKHCEQLLKYLTTVIPSETKKH